ncbi:helix-turn-helix transcriptional regulator [Endozoicomonadaceae bacterium StTr2]
MSVFNSVSAPDQQTLDRLAEDVTAIPFSDTDRQILESLKVVVDGIAAAFGNSCEVALHSLEDLTCSTIKIANSSLSGRRIGSPITPLGLRQLHDISKQATTDTSTSFKHSPDGQLLRSTSMVIRNDEQRPIAMLCVNINMSAPAFDFMQSLLGEYPTTAPEREAFPDTIDDLVEHNIEQTIAEVNSNREISNKAKNRHIIMTLFDKGIFEIKDTVPLVASKLGVTRHTVYLYIRQKKSADT